MKPLERWRVLEKALYKERERKGTLSDRPDQLYSKEEENILTELDGVWEELSDEERTLLNKEPSKCFPPCYDYMKPVCTQCNEKSEVGWDGTTCCNAPAKDPRTM